jgi:hypothetical protein
MGNQTAYPSNDNECIVPSELRPDDAASDSSSEDEDAAKSQGGNDNAQHQRSFVHCYIGHGQKRDKLKDDNSDHEQTKQESKRNMLTRKAKNDRKEREKYMTACVANQIHTPLL